jgi:hypothetical protein
LITTTPDGFRLDATCSLSKTLFFDDRDLPPEKSRDHGSEARIARNRQRIVLALIMCSYHSSDSSLVATIVVVIAIWSFLIQVH